MKMLFTFLTLVALFGAISVSPAIAEPQSLTVTAFVENQTCVGGNFVRVNFSATATSSSQPVGFRWDFNNDGRFDTQLSTDPDASRLFPDEATVTSTVGAVNKEGNRARDSITFTTLRCE
jgi:PKD repeat protein